MKIPITKENLEAWQAFLKDNPNIDKGLIHALSAKVTVHQEESGAVLEISDELHDSLMAFIGTALSHISKIYQLWSVVGGPKDLKKSFSNLITTVHKDVKPEIMLTLDETKVLKRISSKIKTTEFFYLGHQKVKKTVVKVGLNDQKILCAEFSNGDTFIINVVDEKGAATYRLGTKSEITLALS